MRTVAIVLLSCTLASACGTPRERECRVLRPRLEEAEASTGLASNAGRDPSRVFALEAARSSAASRWLGSTVFETPELARTVPALREALDRHADAATRGDRSLHALGLHLAVGDAGPLPFLSRLDSAQSGGESPLVTEAIALNERCGFLLADPKVDHPECSALLGVLARLLAPDGDVKASMHVDERLAEIAAVHSTDAASERALRAIESLLRDVSASLLAVTRDLAATEWIAELRLLSTSALDLDKASRAVRHAVTEARAACPVK